MVVKLEPGSEPNALQKAMEQIKQQPKEPLNLKEFVGILPVKESPLEFHKRLRNEW